MTAEVSTGAVEGEAATALTNGGQTRPGPLLIIPPDTTILLKVLHNFDARSPDELTLRKGEHVELLEKDDEFGDGWYLGRSLTTNDRGLFPQVYTTPAPTPSIVQSPVAITPSTITPLSSTADSISTATTTPIAGQTSQIFNPNPPRPASPANSHISSSHTIDEPHEEEQPEVVEVEEQEHSTPPLTVGKVGARATTSNPGTPQENPAPVIGTQSEEKQASYSQGMRSPVLEDTLSDIDEAITDISNSRQRRASNRHSSITTTPARALTPAEEVIEDSSSAYSRQEEEEEEEIESNSNSEFEDDEEEVVDSIGGRGSADIHTEAVIKTWTPHQVSQYLLSCNIPLTTCQKFEEEEVSGATLLQLEMSHLKELDIGSFGKRFEVWKEIESLVKRAKTSAPVNHRSASNTRSSSTAASVKDSPPRQRSNTVTETALPRIPNQHSRTVSRQHRINIQDANMLDVGVPGHGLLHTPVTSTTIPSQMSVTPPSTRAGVFEAPRSPPISPQRAADAGANYRRTSGIKRLSGYDMSPATGLNAALSAGAAILSAGGTDGTSHHRGRSFDKNWQIPSFGGGARPSTGSKTPEHSHKVSTSVGTGDTVFTGDSGFSGSQPHTPKITATERSYFSSGESTPRERKVLQKKNGGSHTRKSSYTEEQRLRSATAHSRQSRIGSASSIDTTNRKASPIFATAAQAYHARGNSKDKAKRSSSGFSGAPEGFPYDAPKLSPSPSTKGTGIQKRTGDDVIIGRAISPGTPPPLPHPRSISEQLPPMGDSAPSIGSLDGSTPSIAATVESDPVCGTPERPVKVDRSMTTPGRRIRGVSSGTALRQKSKKHNTSAWEKGLREITLHEAAEQADFSGWMKKRGSSGIGVWKQRFFVLQGRRLAYFYSDKDTKERGLIDITSHRVLPATEDRLVSLHASFAAATSPSTSPAISVSTSPQPPTTVNSAEDQKSPTSPPASVKEKEKEKPKEGEKDKGWFTFKLVPPAPGATKGVTFTPPRLHYFATDTREEGKKWMGAIMKATIDRDESKPVISSYNAKTISLAKARQLRARPLELLKGEEDSLSAALLSAGLAITGVDMGVVGEGAEDADVEDERDEVLEKVDTADGEAEQAEGLGMEKTISNNSMVKGNGAVVTALGIVA